MSRTQKKSASRQNKQHHHHVPHYCIAAQTSCLKQLVGKDNTLPKRSVCLLLAASARSTFFQLILTNSFRPECGNWSDESELMVERSAFWLEGILLVSVMVDMMLMIMLMLMTARMLLTSVTCSKGRECFFSNCLLSSSTSASLVKSSYRCKG